MKKGDLIEAIKDGGGSGTKKSRHYFIGDRAIIINIYPWFTLKFMDGQIVTSINPEKWRKVPNFYRRIEL